MIELRWIGRQLQFRQRAFQVDASGAMCGVTEFGEWELVPELESGEQEAIERDEAERAADLLASHILREPIDWPFHNEAWQRAIDKLKDVSR